MGPHSRRRLAAVVCQLLFACAPAVVQVEEPSELAEDGVALCSSKDVDGLKEGSAEAVGVLAVANEADQPTLRTGVGLSKLATSSLLTRRDGPDGRRGTNDDHAFSSLADLSSVCNIGSPAIHALLTWALAHGKVPTLVPVTFSFAPPISSLVKYSTVSLVGSFNNWDPKRAEFQLHDDDGDGVFQVTVKFDPSQIHNVDYKFVLDGDLTRAFNDPTNPRDSGAPFFNSQLAIADPMLVSLSPINGARGVIEHQVAAVVATSAGAPVSQVDVVMNGVALEPKDYSFDAKTGRLTFDASNRLEEGPNTVQVTVKSARGQATASSSFLAFAPASKSFVVGIVAQQVANAVELSADASSPHGIVSYRWEASATNPASVTLSATTTSKVTFVPPTVDGEYRFAVVVADGSGRQQKAQVLVGVVQGQPVLQTADHHATWIDRLVLYEVNPYAWTAGGQDAFSALTASLDRLVALGINAIWLTPVFDGEGMGYWTFDYLHVSPALGTEANLKAFIQAAHTKGIKVVLDLVFNHTADRHPFMQRSLRERSLSPYIQFYLWDGSPGLRYTYLYDWTLLPSLNVANPDVQEYLIDVASFWVREFDVDGFRADVAWAVEQRAPAFWPTFARRLKNLKPDLYLLGEGAAKPMRGSYEELPVDGLGASVLFQDRFASVYDWNFRNFNESVGLPAVLLGQRSIEELNAVVTDPFPARALPLRFIENHDVSRAMKLFGPERSRLAHAMVLTIPGVPLIYSGAETGQTQQFEGPTSGDVFGMRPFLQNLVAIRHQLIDNDAQLVRLPNGRPEAVYSYATLSSGGRTAATVLNLQDAGVTLTVDLTATSTSAGPFDLTPLLGGAPQHLTHQDLATTEVSLSGYGAQIFRVTQSQRLLVNGDFAQGARLWSSYVDRSAAATWAVTNGVASLTIASAGTERWHVQLIHQGVSLHQGSRYAVDVVASAQGTRIIDVAVGRNGGTYADYARSTFTLTTTPQPLHFEFLQTAPSDDAARFVLELGGSTTGVLIDSAQVTRLP